MEVLHIEQLLFHWRHSLCGLELHEIRLESYSPIYASVVLGENIACVGIYILQTVYIGVKDFL